MSNIIDFKSASAQRVSLSRTESDQSSHLLTVRHARLVADRRPLESLTETARNSRLRAQREKAWCAAEVATRYWLAKMDHDEMTILAAKYHIIPAGLYDVNDRLFNVRKWRQAQAAQLLTPAPTVAALTWKRQAFASGQYRLIRDGDDPDKIKLKIERAIEDDAAWLKAHPTRRQRPACEPEIAS